MTSLKSLILGLVLLPSLAQADTSWPSWGKNFDNTKFASDETILSPESVKTLKEDWIFETRSSVYAFPTIQDDWLYATDFPLFSVKGIIDPKNSGGWLYALDKNTGKLRWERSIYDYSGSRANIVSRSSPAIYEDRLIFGDAFNVATPANYLGDPKTSVYAVDRLTGDLLWKTVVEEHNFAQITQSPTVYKGVVYVGVSSGELYVPTALSVLYPCCSFRGSIVALDAKTGKILWQTYTVPKADDQQKSFSGGSVWGSAPSIDEKRGLLYVATGNNYDAPEAFKSCLRDADSDPVKEEACYQKYDPKDNYFDAVLALDLKSGDVRWSKKVMRYDAWNFACNLNIGPIPNPISIACPRPAGGDDDFAQAPMLLRDVTIDGVTRDLVVAGQKTGVFWAFDPDKDGEIVWTRKVGPDGIIGGHEFGSASDGKRIYVQITNLEHTSFDLTAGMFAGQTTNGGIWAALDIATGEILWQTPVPNSKMSLTGNISSPKFGEGLGLGFFALAQGPLSVGNGVVYAGSLDGTMVAMNAETGEILWSKQNKGSINSAPSIVDGALYWGAGYPVGFPDNKIYRFSPK
ncbi:MAG: polyvinylalcohol dehydrogenase [Proteobacteria bacterium]|nr:MAG: polyvinylalcohol dehydrogenase [Pseudomonadota bacterium]